MASRLHIAARVGAGLGLAAGALVAAIKIQDRLSHNNLYTDFRERVDRLRRDVAPAERTLVGTNFMGVLLVTTVDADDKLTIVIKPQSRTNIGVLRALRRRLHADGERLEVGDDRLTWTVVRSLVA